MKAWDAPMENSNISYLQYQNQGASTDWFEYDPDCRWVVDEGCRLIAANQNARDAIRDNHIIANHNGRLNFGSDENNQRTRSTIKNMLQQGITCRQHLVLRVLDGHWRSFAFTHVKSDRSRQVIIAMKNCKHPNSSEINSLAKAFDLTHTEALVLEAMMDIDQPKVIAAEMGISIYTVRAHLRTIYAKMGARGHVAALKMLINLLN